VLTWQYALAPAGLILIEADGGHPLIEAVAVVITPLFFTFPIILCWGWANIAQYPTQPVRLGQGITIVVVVVIRIVGAICHCDVLQMRILKKSARTYLRLTSPLALPTTSVALESRDIAGLMGQGFCLL
jgi:hypothetical protein